MGETPGTEGAVSDGWEERKLFTHSVGVLRLRVFSYVEDDIPLWAFDVGTDVDSDEVLFIVVHYHGGYRSADSAKVAALYWVIVRKNITDYQLHKSEEAE